MLRSRVEVLGMAFAVFGEQILIAGYFPTFFSSSLSSSHYIQPHNIPIHWGCHNLPSSRRWTALQTVSLL